MQQEKSLAQSRHIHEIIQYHAQQQPQHVCLIDNSNNELSYFELWQLVEQASKYLAQRGVKAGDRVMVVCENAVDVVTLMLACSRLHAWPVSVNARLSAREIDTIAAHAQPVLTFYTSAVSTAALAHAKHQNAEEIVCDFLRETNYVRHQHVERYTDDSTPAAEDIAMLIYTSGTTGSPKGVMVPHKGLVHFARISAQARHLTPNDRAYAALPLSHIFGIATVLLATFYAGGSLVLRAKFDVDDVRKTLADQQLTILQGVPTMFNRILADVSADEKLSAPALRYLYTGGAALDASLKSRVEALFDMPLHHGYGITEYAGSLFLTRFEAPATDCSAGYAVEGLEIHIGDLSERALAADEIGDIYVRGPGVMRGYFRDQEQTVEALMPGGWLKTGDLGYLTNEGALYITGRSKDLIIRSGFNVYPLEVEAVINAYPGVALSAAVGIPCEDGNEEIVMFCQVKAGEIINYDDLRAHAREQLAPYKRPSHFIEIQQIPTTVSGKIQKKPLREQALLLKKNEEIV